MKKLHVLYPFCVQYHTTYSNRAKNIWYTLDVQKHTNVGFFKLYKISGFYFLFHFFSLKKWASLEKNPSNLLISGIGKFTKKRMGPCLLPLENGFFWISQISVDGFYRAFHGFWWLFDCFLMASTNFFGAFIASKLIFLDFINFCSLLFFRFEG